MCICRVTGCPSADHFVMNKLQFISVLTKHVFVFCLWVNTLVLLLLLLLLCSFIVDSSVMGLYVFVCVRGCVRACVLACVRAYVCIPVVCGVV